MSVGDGKDVTTTLTLAEGQSVRSDSAAMQACAIRGSWKAENPGAWANVPAYDCSTAVNLTRRGVHVGKADVSRLVTPGGLSDIIIVPVTQPVGGAVDPGFQVTITKASATADGTPPADTFTTVQPSSSSASRPAPRIRPSQHHRRAPRRSHRPRPGRSPPQPPRPRSTRPRPAGAPANLSPPPAAVSSQPFGKPALTQVGGPTRHKPWSRLLFLVPLAALVGAGAAFARRQVLLTAIQ